VSRVTYGRNLTLLLGIAVVGQILMLVRPVPADSLNISRSHVEAIITKLRTTGIDLRMVSQRGDGLWDNAFYLTKTNKDEQELEKVPADPDFLDHWQGTVVVMRLGNRARYDNQLDHWGDACMVNGELVFFGDKELLREIRRCLEEG
jgi:hypothetical protein